jgi:transposase
LAVGLDYDYARRIIRKYNKMGVDAVQNYRNKNAKNHRGGSQPLLNEEQLNGLREACQGKATDGGVWTGPKVARWIERETGKSQAHNLIGWNYLKKLYHFFKDVIEIKNVKSKTIR